MKESFYFKHDNNASQDLRLVKLKIKMGFEGIGIFWTLIELLSREGGRVEFDPELIAHSIGADAGKVESVVKDFGLFIVDSEGLYSPRLVRDIESRTEKITRASSGGKNSASTRKENPASSGNEKSASSGKKIPLQVSKEIKEKEESKGEEGEKEKKNVEQKENFTPNSQKILEVGNFIKQVEAKHADPSAPTPVNNPNAQPSTTIFDLKVRAWKEIYQANEHPDKLQRPYLEAINLLKAQHPDLDAHEFLVALTKKYLAFCTANNRFKLNGLKFLTDNTFLDDWTIKPGQKTTGNTPENPEPRRKRITIMPDGTEVTRP